MTLDDPYSLYQEVLRPRDLLALRPTRPRITAAVRRHLGDGERHRQMQMTLSSFRI